MLSLFNSISQVSIHTHTQWCNSFSLLLSVAAESFSGRKLFGISPTFSFRVDAHPPRIHQCFFAFLPGWMSLRKKRYWLGIASLKCREKEHSLDHHLLYSSRRQSHRKTGGIERSAAKSFSIRLSRPFSSLLLRLVIELWSKKGSFLFSAVRRRRDNWIISLLFRRGFSQPIVIS